MIIEDELKIRKREWKKKLPNGEEKKYRVVFVTFSSKYSPILKDFKELHNVVIVTPHRTIEIPKVRLHINGYNYRRKTGEKIPQYGFTIPVMFAEMLLEEGVEKVKVIANVPDKKVKIIQ